MDKLESRPAALACPSPGLPAHPPPPTSAGRPKRPIHGLRISHIRYPIAIAYSPSSAADSANVNRPSSGCVCRRLPRPAPARRDRRPRRTARQGSGNVPVPNRSARDMSGRRQADCTPGDRRCRWRTACPASECLSTTAIYQWRGYATRSARRGCAVGLSFRRRVCWGPGECALVDRRSGRSRERSRSVDDCAGTVS